MSEPLFRAAFHNPTNPLTDYYTDDKEYVDDQLKAMDRLREVFPLETGLGDLDALSQGYRGVAVDLSHLYILGWLCSGCEDEDEKKDMGARSLELATKLKTTAAALVTKARAVTAQLEALEEPIARAHALAASNKRPVLEAKKRKISAPPPRDSTLRQLMLDYRVAYETDTVTEDLVKKVIDLVRAEFPAALRCEYSGVPSAAPREFLDLDEAVETWKKMKTMPSVELDCLSQVEAKDMVEGAFPGAASVEIFFS